MSATPATRHMVHKRSPKPRVEYDDNDNTVAVTMQIHLPKLYKNEMILLMHLAKRKYSQGCKLPETFKNPDDTQHFDTERAITRLLSLGLVARVEVGQPLPRFRITPAGYEVARSITPHGNIRHYTPGARPESNMSTDRPKGWKQQTDEELRAQVLEMFPDPDDQRTR